MKSILLFFALSFSLVLSAQKTVTDLFTTEEIVWYGLDFSNAKMVGDFGQVAGGNPVKGSEIKSKYIQGWNALFFNEPEKYNIARTFKKSKVFNDLAAVEKNNAELNEENLMSYNEYKFADAVTTVQKTVEGYTLGEKKEGVGVVFIIESFNKTEQIASIYVAVFDIATKKVLISENIKGLTSGGIGLRNYWATAIKAVLNKIEDRKYKDWKIAAYGK